MEDKSKKKGKKRFRRPSRDSYIVTLMTGVVLFTLCLIPFCLIFFPTNKDIIETLFSFLEKEVLALFTISASIINTNQYLPSKKKKR